MANGKMRSDTKSIIIVKRTFRTKRTIFTFLLFFLERPVMNYDSYVFLGYVA